MLLFRSEQDVLEWCRSRNRAPGEMFPLEKGWQLAQAWYQDRLHPNWQRADAAKMRRALGALGFTSEFWSL